MTVLQLEHRTPFSLVLHLKVNSQFWMSFQVIITSISGYEVRYRPAPFSSVHCRITRRVSDNHLSQFDIHLSLAFGTT